MYQVGYFLIRNATSYPDRLALVFNDQKLTYRELNERANRLANSLLSLGIVKGDRLAFLFRNSIEWVLIWYATQKLGVTAVPLNLHLLSNEIARTINISECKTFIYQEEFNAIVQEAKGQCPELKWVICCGDKIPNEEYDLHELCLRGSGDEAQVQLSGEDESLLLFTSGTTGVSKGVIRSQQMVRDYALMSALQNNNCHSHEVLLTHCPLFHTGGFSGVIKMAALCGTLILVDKVRPQEILEKVEQYQVTQTLMIPPILYERLIQDPDWQKYDLSSVKEAHGSGGKLCMQYAKTMFTLFPNCRIRTSWGSTETCAPTSTLLSREILEKNPELCKTTGKLNTMVEVRLVDEQGNDVIDGEVGEALVRSSMVFNGYLKMPEKTAEVLKEDGWFYTEDLMKRDADGYYYLLDRKRDMVKTGGENVYAQEVESVLRDHPAIRDCAIIGVPDPKFGEAIAAAIVLNPGAFLSSDDFITYCKANMPSYKKPRYWTFMDNLPTNSVGKIQKSKLRAQASTLFTRIKE